MLKRLAVLLVCLPAWFNAVAATDYRGFQVDDRLLSGEYADPAIAASIVEQLKIVESVGLPAAVLDLFRQARVLVDPALRGNPGVFEVHGGEGLIRLRPIVFPANRPILLHELLHAYHFKVLTMGNQEIHGAYRQARDDGVFTEQYPRASFLQNHKEFFAVTGTIYLFGTIGQPPFRCDALARTGAAYLAFLARQFGPHECRRGSP